jgi:CheY-like chemotaxis protein
MSDILIVDDSDDIAALLLSVLEAEGYSAARVPNGALALSWLEATPELPRLILLDLRMPVMDGAEFRRRQLADQRISRIPVVVLTGTPADAAPELGARTVLVKPVDPGRLLLTVEEIVRGCANPACRQPLDWAAGSAPRADTPQSRIHHVLTRSGPAKDYMCYACGHYTCLHPVTITIRKANSHVEMVGETQLVNRTFLHFILDEIERAQIRRPGKYLKLLVEIRAPETSVSPLEALDVFQRAMSMGLRGAQVAYVITGRP